MANSQSVGLSLIVCTRNRAPFLEKLLASVERELVDRLDLEVVVVDNGSSDATTVVANQFAGRLPGLRILSEPKPGLSYARNCGARGANKDYLLYVDDDAYLSEAFLDHTEVILRRFKPDLFGGPVLPYFDCLVPGWYDPRLEIRKFEEFSGFSEMGSISGGNFGIRRDVLQRLGPFDTALGMRGNVMAFGEDREMVERYRASTPKAEHRLYYAVELPIMHYTMPQKLDVAYQLARKYENSRAQERTFVRTGKRSLARSILYLCGHVGLMPYQWWRVIARNGFNANGRFKAYRHAYAIAGRAHGALDLVRDLVNDKRYGDHTEHFGPAQVDMTKHLAQVRPESDPSDRHTRSIDQRL